MYLHLSVYLFTCMCLYVGLHGYLLGVKTTALAATKGKQTYSICYRLSRLFVFFYRRARAFYPRKSTHAHMRAYMSTRYIDKEVHIGSEASI